MSSDEVTPTPRRGDGIGLEVCTSVVRGVRLGAGTDEYVAAAAEVAIARPSDDRSVVDALIYLRAELGDRGFPTRAAVFPQASTLQRIDVTGHSGVELNALRTRLRDREGIGSTMLVDTGPRRWLIAIRWDDAALRRTERRIEVAGFVDVSVEPSPIALGRVVPTSVRKTTRYASPPEAFGALFIDQVPVAAVSIDPIGVTTPDLGTSAEDFPPTWFDELTDADALAAEVGATGLPTPTGRAVRIGWGPWTHPAYPDADLRSPRRQCVALGAAIGAAGLAGLVRPVDTVTDAAHIDDEHDRRPWAVERVAEITAETRRPEVGTLRKRIARLTPRRNR